MRRFLKLPAIFVHVPFLWVGGLTIFPWVFFQQANPPAWLINHEKIHLRQQFEMGILPFYVWYVIEFLVRWLQFRNSYRAYRNISFEREAYQNDKNLDYLHTRTRWQFWYYL